MAQPSDGVSQRHDRPLRKLTLYVDFAERGFELSWPPFHCVIEGKEQDRSDQRRDETSRLSFLIPPNRPTNPGCGHRPSDAKKDCHDEPAGVLSRHDELGQCPYDESN